MWMVDLWPIKPVKTLVYDSFDVHKDKHSRTLMKELKGTAVPRRMLALGCVAGCGWVRVD